MFPMIALLGLLLFASPALAQPSGDHTPGIFDYYVLALSWSPSYCEAEGRKADRRQCASGRPYAFVAHGLWPQYERGWPEFCRADESWVPRRQIDAMLDIMPNPGLVIHQWKKHGTCSGMTPNGYFDRLRRAYSRIAIPGRFKTLTDYTMTDPGEVEREFRLANPGLEPDMISVQCDLRRLREVWICMDKNLEFRSCPPVDRRACRRDRIVVPPVR